MSESCTPMLELSCGITMRSLGHVSCDIGPPLATRMMLCTAHTSRAPANTRKGTEKWRTCSYLKGTEAPSGASVVSLIGVVEGINPDPRRRSGRVVLSGCDDPQRMC